MEKPSTIFADIYAEPAILGHDRVRRLHYAFSDFHPRNSTEDCQLSTQVDPQVDYRDIREHHFPDPEFWHISSLPHNWNPHYGYCYACWNTEEWYAERIWAYGEWILPPRRERGTFGQHRYAWS